MVVSEFHRGLIGDTNLRLWFCFLQITEELVHPLSQTFLYLSDEGINILWRKLANGTLGVSIARFWHEFPKSEDLASR
jgi:hypothetical protein